MPKCTTRFHPIPISVYLFRSLSISSGPAKPSVKRSVTRKRWATSSRPLHRNFHIFSYSISTQVGLSDCFWSQLSFALITFHNIIYSGTLPTKHSQHAHASFQDRRGLLRESHLFSLTYEFDWSACTFVLLGKWGRGMGFLTLQLSNPTLLPSWPLPQNSMLIKLTHLT